MFGFSPGPWEMLIIMFLAVLLFGKRLPEVARSIGKGISEFKKGLNEWNEGTYAESTPRYVEQTPTREEPKAPKFELPDEELEEIEKQQGATADSSAVSK